MASVSKPESDFPSGFAKSMLDNLRIPRFCHEPLHDASKEIRLLHLHAPAPIIGRASAPVLDMLTFDLTDGAPRPSYCALSWTWVNPLQTPDSKVYDEDKRKLVIINGKWFPVSLNLFLALRQISKNFYKIKKNQVIIWVDAICIDQSEDTEKAEQVRRMGEIYSKATGTVVWLGPADDTTKTCFRKIERVAMKHDQQTAAATRRGEDLWFGNSTGEILLLGRKLQGHEIGIPNVLTCQELNRTRGIPEIKKLMFRTWWKRSWIWQEVACSPRTLIMCGKYELDLNAFYKLTSALVNDMATNDIFGFPIEPLFLRGLQYVFQPITTMIKLRQQLAPTPGHQWRTIDLAQVLGHLRHTLATDPRDKVYAGLGMCNQSHGINVNYKIPLQRLYADVVHQYIRANNELSIFNYCQFRSEYRPSWAPDWTDRRTQRHRLDLIDSSFIPGSRLYQAGGPPHVETEVSVNLVAMTMSVMGAEFSQIAFVAQDRLILPERQQSSVGMPSLRDNFRRGLAASLDLAWLKQWAHQTRSYPWISDEIDEIVWLTTLETLTYQVTGEDILQAYMRTIHADVITSFTWSAKKRISDWNTIPEDANMDSNLIGRTFASTTDDEFGLVPVETEAGDIIAIFKGGDLSYVLRPTTNGYLMIGECYLHGFMDGEAFDQIEQQGAWEPITLV